MVKLLKALLENCEGRTVNKNHIKELETVLNADEFKFVLYKDVIYINIVEGAKTKLNDYLEGLQNENKEAQYVKRLIRQKEFLLSPDRKDEVLGYLHENNINHELIEVAGREFVKIK